MNSTSYKKRWLEVVREEETTLRGFCEEDVFNDWEQKKVATGIIGFELRNGIELFYSGLDPELANCFMVRSLALNERAEREGKTGTQYDRAESVMCKAHTRAILENETQSEILRLAAPAFLACIADEHPSKWFDLEQSYFLAAVAAHLIVGDVDEALKLFDRIGTLTWYQPEAPLYRDLCKEWLANQKIAEDLSQRFHQHFDVLRDPDYRPERFSRLTELRLEYGAILWKYVLHGGAEIDWNDVIEIISR